MRDVACYWYQNIQPVSVPPLTLTATYEHSAYKKYDLYDAINVDKIKDIPKDYYGTIGTSIRILDRLCEDQFELIGMLKGCAPESYQFCKPFVEGAEKFTRVLIRRKQ